MTITAGVVESPAVEPARFGLLSAADVVNHSGTDEHWISGFHHETEACYFNATLRDVCALESESDVYVSPTGPRSFPAYPFSINAIDKCSTFGFNSTDRRERVLRQLELITAKAVEKELWTGAFGTELTRPDHRFLADSSATTLNGGTAVKPALGLALLEAALANLGPGYEGVIHMTRDTASMLAGHYRQTPEDAGVLETMLGTKVAAGVGYDGTGPGNVAITGTNRWMYVTGPVTVHLGPKQVVNEKVAWAVDAHINDLVYQAERPAVVVWDGCVHAAVRVDLSL